MPPDIMAGPASFPALTGTAPGTTIPGQTTLGQTATGPPGTPAPEPDTLGTLFAALLAQRSAAAGTVSGTLPKTSLAPAGRQTLDGQKTREALMTIGTKTIGTKTMDTDPASASSPEKKSTADDGLLLPSAPADVPAAASPLLGLPLPVVPVTLTPLSETRPDSGTPSARPVIALSASAPQERLFQDPSFSGTPGIALPRTFTLSQVTGQKPSPLPTPLPTVPPAQAPASSVPAVAAPALPAEAVPVPADVPQEAALPTFTPLPTRTPLPTFTLPGAPSSPVVALSVLPTVPATVQPTASALPSPTAAPAARMDGLALPSPSLPTVPTAQAPASPVPAVAVPALPVGATTVPAAGPSDVPREAVLTALTSLPTRTPLPVGTPSEAPTSPVGALSVPPTVPALPLPPAVPAARTDIQVRTDASLPTVPTAQAPASPLPAIAVPALPAEATPAPAGVPQEDTTPPAASLPKPRAASSQPVSPPAPNAQTPGAAAVAPRVSAVADPAALPELTAQAAGIVTGTPVPGVSGTPVVRETAGKAPNALAQNAPAQNTLKSAPVSADTHTVRNTGSLTSDTSASDSLTLRAAALGAKPGSGDAPVAALAARERSDAGDSSGTDPEIAFGAAPAPTAEAARAVAVPLSAADRAAIVRQVADSVGVMPLPAAPGKAEQMTLQLHPKDWGKLQVSVTVTPGTEAGGARTVAAHIVADTPQVKAALESGRTDLHQTLREAGLHLDHLTVSVKPAEVNPAEVNPASESAASGMPFDQSRQENSGFSQGSAGQGASSQGSAGQTPNTPGSPSSGMPSFASFAGGHQDGRQGHSAPASAGTASAAVPEPDAAPVWNAWTRPAAGRIDLHA